MAAQTLPHPENTDEVDEETRAADVKAAAERLKAVRLADGRYAYPVTDIATGATTGPVATQIGGRPVPSAGP